MVPVKICGITRLEDAELAAQFGASWVGFVFWRARPRFVEPSAARNILSKLLFCALTFLRRCAIIFYESNKTILLLGGPVH